MSAITSQLGKPSVFSTAISVRRSRTAMLIVLAVTSRMVNATASPMLFSSSARLPPSAAKLPKNAFSVSLFVWTSLFSNVESIGLDSLRRGAGIGNLDDEQADARPLPGALVQILVVKEHHRLIDARVLRDVHVVDATHRELEWACRSGTAG